MAQELLVISVIHPGSPPDRACNGHGLDYPHRAGDGPRPGRLVAAPWSLTGGGAEAPRSGVAEGHFRKETRGALDGGGAPPPTKRAIPGPEPGFRPALPAVAPTQRDRARWRRDTAQVPAPAGGASGHP